MKDFCIVNYSGFEAAYIIWEKALIPSLLNGSGTWLGAGKDTYELCNEIQKFYWKTLLEVPYSTPKVALQCETGCMEMSPRINKFEKQEYTQPSLPYPPLFVDQPCRRRNLTIQPTGRLGFQPSRM